MNPYLVLLWISGTCLETASCALIMKLRCFSYCWEHTDSATLTTWVSLEAFATASPLSEKYLNNTTDQILPAALKGQTPAAWTPATHLFPSYLLMLVWKPSTLVFTAPILSRIFSWSRKERVFTCFGHTVSAHRKMGCSQKSYLDGDAKVVPVFYFWDEMLNPAGDLQQHRQFNFRAPQTLKPRTFPT